jgi:hypothetical protein
MKYRKLDDLGDYTLGTGGDFYVNSPEAVAQAILTRLRLYRGEWFIDTKEGTPWFQDVLGKYTQRTYDAVVRLRILRTQGVRAILSFTSVYDGAARTLVQSSTVDTIYGTTSVTLTNGEPA